MRKIPKSDFNRFKKEFVRWMDILSLRGYKIFFFHEPLEDCYAAITIDEAGKAANVSYTSTMSKVDYEHTEGPEAHAKHEVIHLLLGRIKYLGVQRWTASDEIVDEEEKLVRILEKALE